MIGLWRLIRMPLLLGVGGVVGFLGPYVAYLDVQVRDRFDDLSWQAPSRVFARPLLLAPGLPMSAEALRLELDAARYQSAPAANIPGTWHANGGEFLIARRGFVYLDGRERPRRLKATVAGGRIAALADADTGASLPSARLDPARIATLYGSQQEERQVVALGHLPPLLIAGLQAVEDRDFKHHHGIDVSAIARATWVNLSAGRVVQGGSTLTQQLVRNLFLDRSRNLPRKINEAFLALLIEARYDKERILDAYVNEVFLGQHGSQAVHGFAAASEYWFGRDIGSIGPADTALLVGLVRGPSYYDPRRYPDRALARRNTVLRQFNFTGLIDKVTLATALAQPLHVTRSAALPRNRYPAFLDAVRRQLQSDYTSSDLAGAGLSIQTTLAPSTQIMAENALEKGIASLGKRGDPMQAALVVTGARDGEIAALIGNRNPDTPGFNRALDATRPIGSLVKPFVYLVALTQPQRWSLATLIDDSPVDIPQRDGSRWQPTNDDDSVHGSVPLIEALVHSWNLATVHLGLAIGVDKVRGLLTSFNLGRPINPNPSLLLGALDLSPLDVARLYQYFAADGHALPLRSVRGVLDAQGRPLRGYAVRAGGGDYVDAVRLTNHAMQQVVARGTAHAITDGGLGALHAAGKTGTSDSQRDSWFAGFTGAHLAVAWIGRDDNKPTGLYGASGALRIWIELFRNLPTTPLTIPQEGLETVYVDPATAARTDAACAGARQMPFIRGHAPAEYTHCTIDRLREWLDGR